MLIEPQWKHPLATHTTTREISCHGIYGAWYRERDSNPHGFPQRIRHCPVLQGSHVIRRVSQFRHPGTHSIIDRIFAFYT